MSVQSVQVTINGQNYTLTYNGSSGKWEATITAPSITSYNVNAGHYYPVTVQATDDAGNVTIKNDTDPTLGASLKLLVKEHVKPTLAITAPSTGARVTSATPAITFQLRDEANGSGIKIDTLALKIDGGAAVGNGAAGMTVNSVSGGYDCTYVPQAALSEGNHTITIDVQDNDSNSATQLSSVFTVDTVPPALNVSSPGAGLVTNNASLTVAGTTNDVTSSPVTVTVKLNGVDQGAVAVTEGAFSKAITLAEGSNTIVVRATDTAGKFSEITRTVTLDTGAPTIAAVTIAPNPADCGATFVVTVTVSD